MFLYQRGDTTETIEPGNPLPVPLDSANLRTRLFAICDSYGDDIGPLMSGNNTEFSSLTDVAEREQNHAALRSANLTGRYELLYKLGQGGFGVVYLARGRDNGVMYAVKFMRSTPAHDLTSAVTAESSILRNLGPSCMPYICYVEHGRTVAGDWIFITDFINGIDLHHFIYSPLYQQASELAVLILMIAITEKVSILHTLVPPIYHKDLKPANIMVVSLGGTNYDAKIIDFGISEVGRISNRHGTPQYMPENDVYDYILGRRKYYYIDLYALCMTFHELYSRVPEANRTLAFTTFINSLLAYFANDVATKIKARERTIKIPTMEEFIAAMQNQVAAMTTA